MPNIKKIFILDTNVILHDSSCINCFDEHDIIIPIPVLEELDQFKKGSQIINDHARQFVRQLDELSTDKLFNGGIPLGEGTKIVFTGDINQIDHPYLGIRSNGLSTLIDKMQGQKLYAHIDLQKGERSELAELASNIL
jgi:PhoH-like ATPase